MVTFGFSLRQTWQTLCLDIGLLGKTYIKLNTFNFKDGFKIRQFYPSQRSTPPLPRKKIKIKPTLHRCLQEYLYKVSM